MRRIPIYIFFLTMCCAKATMDPVYSLPEPLIEFKSIEMKRSKRIDEPDTIILQLKIMDGDRDLGLDFPFDPPYNYENAILKSTGEKVDLAKIRTSEQASQVIRYSDRKVHPFDTLPRFVPPYNCKVWSVLTVGNKVDTIYSQKNINFYNIQVLFLIESTNGTFQPFDFGSFGYPQCANDFSGRFPRTDFTTSYTSGPFRLSLLSSASGNFFYKIQSIGFHAPIWSPKKIKFRVSIIDRALRRSNVIETNVVQL